MRILVIPGCGKRVFFGHRLNGPVGQRLRKENEMTSNTTSAQLTSYEPAKISLDLKAATMDEGELDAYKRALTAIELSKRVTGDIDPTIYEQAALGIRSQAQAQAQAAGTTLAKTLKDGNIPAEQYELMVRMQAQDMVNQGLALDAWAMHYQIEPGEDDVAELLNQMAPGGERELLEKVGEDPAQLQALSSAVLRYAANKHAAQMAELA